MVARALKGVALRGDAPVLAQRGIAMVGSTLRSCAEPQALRQTGQERQAGASGLGRPQVNVRRGLIAPAADATVPRGPGASKVL